MRNRPRPTDQQQAVIEHEEGHALVRAVAGAGKTFAIVERISRLVCNGVPSNRIIGIQYNKPAQLAMQQKLKDRLQGREVPQARTFHSIGLAMMKRLTEVGAIAPARLVTDDTVRERSLRAALKTAWKRTHGPNAAVPQQVQEGFEQFVTRVKADVRSAADIFRESDYTIECAPYVNAFATLDEQLEEQKICFFDDLLARTYWALEERPELWALFSNRVDHLVVDEFQDVNPVQYRLLQGIAGTRASVMAVGDDDQAIYSFRGSDRDFIATQFASDFSPCRHLRLTNTFRYGHETALIANHIIAKHPDRDPKISVAAPQNPDTKVLHLTFGPTDPSGLVHQLTEPKAAQRLREHAMLVRYYSASVPFEIELAEAGIPFHTYGREPLLLLPEIAALVAALSLAVDHWTVPEPLRPRFLGALLRSPTIYATREQIQRMGHAMHLALTAGQNASDEIFAEVRRQHDDARLQGRLRERGDVVRMLEAGGLAKQAPAKIIASYLALTNFQGAITSMAATAAQADEMLRNVTAFTELSKRYDTAHQLLDTLGPLAAQRADQPPAGDHFAILSIHRSKGAEWPTVYLPGWTAGAFPRDSEDQDEERRLAYVAVTRAIDQLVFLHPKDVALEERDTHLDQLPPSGQKVTLSPFLYDAETGLCAAVADAIRLKRPAHVRARIASVVNRYVAEAGLQGISVSVPKAIEKELQQTARQRTLSLDIGARLKSADGQPYEVSSKVGERFYYVQPLAGGDPRLICLDEPGWMIDGVLT